MQGVYKGRGFGWGGGILDDGARGSEQFLEREQPNQICLHSGCLMQSGGTGENETGSGRRAPGK